MASNPYVDANGDYIVPGAGDIAAGPTGQVAQADTAQSQPTPPEQGTFSAAPVIPQVSGQPVDPYDAPVAQGGAPRGIPGQAPGKQTAGQVSQTRPGVDPSTDVAAADKAVQDSIRKTQADDYAANMAKLNAENDKQDRLAGAQQQHADNLNAINQQEIQSREQAHAQAAAETTSWMNQMDQLSKQEPNRGRYWENTSSFGKAMWILGIAATAISNSGHPGMPNAALQMLQTEIGNDVGDQKDRLQRQIAQGERGGKMMVDRQNQRLTDIHDDFSKEVTRYSALRDAALTKAAVYPPGTSQNLAWTQAAQEADKMMAQTATKKQEQTFQAKTQSIAITAENMRAAASNANAMAIARLHDNTTNRVANMENQAKYDLARIAAESKAAGKDAENAPEFRIPTSSGFSVVNESTPGTAPRPLGIKKEQQEKAVSEAAEYTNRLYQLKKFRQNLSDASTYDYLTKSSSALDSIRIELGASIGKGLNGGRGPLNEGDQKRGEQVLGADYDSLFDRIRKGVDRKQALKLLDDKIAQVGGEAQFNISSKYGTDLQNGERLIYNPEEALKNYSTEPALAPTAEEENVKAGGTSEAVAPKTPEEYNRLKNQEAVVGPGLMTELPQDIRGKVDSAVSAMSNGSTNHVNQVANGAIAALDALAKSNPKSQSSVDQAKVALRAEQRTAFEESQKNANTAVEQMINQSFYPKKSIDSIADNVFDKAKLNHLTPKEKADFIANVKDALGKSLPEATNKATGMVDYKELVSDTLKAFNER